ncbi:MAG: hypothetical protein E7173_03990 [Firmicutes bacterium]|nr:hypothetical protein [Bacillota bacterium]
MRNVKVNKLITILLTCLILIATVGCSNKKETSRNNEMNDYNNSGEVEENDVNKQDKPEINNPEMSNDKNAAINLTKTDEEAIAYFNTLKQNVDNTLDSSNQNDDVKAKLKGTFITIVDFIFYDGDINGIKFDDLTDGAKQNILETAAIIDNSIMTKFPNYKEDISSTVSIAYKKASELIKSGANNIKEFSKETLGEDNYNTIIGAKDELVSYTKEAIDIIGDFAGTLWDKGKGKIKNWYENFKNN